jgi:hypothetical protein
MPPLEMVFPPSPTSRSRFDPKRYTLELPPPLLRGTLSDDLHEKCPHSDHRCMEVLEARDEELDENVIRVEWDAIPDNESRQKVLDALRLLRA